MRAGHPRGRGAPSRARSPGVWTTHGRCPQESHTVVPLSTPQAVRRRRLLSRATGSAARPEFTVGRNRTSDACHGPVARDDDGAIDSTDARARGRRGADPAAQPRGRGVAARGDDAEPRGDHRRGRGAPRGAPTSTSPRTASIFDAALRAAQPGRAGRPGHGRRGAAPARRSSTQLGGRQTLLRIQAATPASANAAHYAQIVAELAMLRRLIETAGDIQEMAYATEDDVDETLDRAEAADLRGRRAARRRHAGAAVPRARADDGPARGALRPRQRRSSASPTGYHDLDELLLGLQPSTLVDRRGPSRPGKDVARARHGAARRAARPQAGAVLLDGDGPPRAHEASARGRGAGRRRASCRPASSPSTSGRSSTRRSAGSPKRRSSSTTTRTAP